MKKEMTRQNNVGLAKRNAWMVNNCIVTDITCAQTVNNCVESVTKFRKCQ